MRCIHNEEHRMWDPAVWLDDKKENPIILGYYCELCKSKFLFMTRHNPLLNNFKENEIQEIDKDNNIIMYNCATYLPSKDQTKHIAEIVKLEK